MKTRTLLRRDASRIELLESRIAPAAAIHITDVDGDLVTIFTSKGTDAQLGAVVTLGAPNLLGGQAISVIDLAGDAVFDGTDLTVTAKPGPMGGDGLVDVGAISATGLDLGTLTIDGGLTSSLSAGKNTPASKVQAINARSVSGTHIWTINASVGVLHVATDVADEEIHINGPGGLGALIIGGSLIGNPIGRTGYLTVPNGKIGSVKIGGDIIGGTGADSGEITAGALGAVTIGGSIRGAPSDPGGATHSGMLEATGLPSLPVGVPTMGAVKIGGDLRGGALIQSGFITSAGPIASVTVAGSVIGGSKVDSGAVRGGAEIGPVKIGGDLQGGGGGSSGDIRAAFSLGAVTIGGSMIGGAGGDSAQITCTISLGPVKIGGNLRGGSGGDSGEILAGTALASVTIGGSFIGGTGGDSGEIRTVVGNIGAVKIGHDVEGGAGASSGRLRSAGNLAALSIKGDYIGGSGPSSGGIDVTGDVGKISIGGSVIVGLNVDTARIDVGGTAGAITIGKNLIGSTSSLANIRVRGHDATAGKMSVALKRLSIGGRVEHALIAAGSYNGMGTNPDAQIGSVKVGGDWIASSLSAGAQPGADGWFGTADDAPITQAGEPDAFFSKIASIIIVGRVEGTSGPGDHFGFVAQEVGAFRVNGIAFKLTPGRSNDTSVADTHLNIGVTGDVTIHEVT